MLLPKKIFKQSKCKIKLPEYHVNYSKSLSKEIVHLLTDKDHANQLGELGRKNTFELFSASKMAEETLAVYQQFTDS